MKNKASVKTESYSGDISYLDGKKGKLPSLSEFQTFVQCHNMDPVNWWISIVQPRSSNV